VAEYVLTNERWRGTKLNVGRIPRQQIDAFIAENPQPSPPVRKAADLGIEVWGDPEATVEWVDDPEFRVQSQRWQLVFGRKMVDVFAGVVEAPQDVEALAFAELEEMNRAELAAGGDRAEMLWSVLCDEGDMAEVVRLVLYESTVTVRGLLEAQRFYNVRWNGKLVPVMAKDRRWLATANSVFGDRLAARKDGITWEEFCELSGPEQSKVVALYRLQDELTAIRTRTR